MDYLPIVIGLWGAFAGLFIVVMCQRIRLAKLERDIRVLSRNMRNMIARSGA